MDSLMYIVIWVVFCVLVGSFGSGRKIGFLGSFFLSLLLSPLIGFIITLFSKSLDSEKLEKEILNNQKEQTKLLAESKQKSIADEIEKLSNLKDKGVITEAEFQSGKGKLLSNN